VPAEVLKIVDAIARLLADEHHARETDRKMKIPIRRKRVLTLRGRRD